jgi:CheY-like chemotaxis protein
MARVSDHVLLADSGWKPGEALTILLVDGRPVVRAELHNFFEAAGYNFLEAADAAEAAALGEVHEGEIDLLIADSMQISKILEGLGSSHPALRVLRIQDQGGNGPDEIRQPFTRQILLEKVAALLQDRTAAPAG